MKSHSRFNVSSALVAPHAALHVLLFLLGLGAALSCARAADTSAPLIPIATLFRSPELAQMKLSPDGTHVAYLAPYERRQNLFVRRIGDDPGIRLTAATARDLGGYYWLGNNRLAYSIDEGGKENWRIYAIDRDGSNAKLLTPEIGVRAQLVAQLPEDDDHLLIRMNQRDPRVPDLHRVNVKTGETELVVRNDRNYANYFTDNTGTVRLATGTDGVNITLYHRLTDAAPFERILSTDFRASVGPLFFTADNRYFYALSNRHTDKIAIVLIDPQDGREVEVLYQNPEYDAAGLIRDHEKKVIGASYVGDKPERVYFDERARNRHLEIARQLPGLTLDFVSGNRAGTQVIVKAWSDRDPGTFYFYNEADQRLTKIGAVAPWIDPRQLATVKPVSYRSRDGLTIHGYLTLPLGASGPQPTLLVIHGGPWARDQWRADPEVQFLANRGYAVLQINYRGSTGYGRAFVEAGFKQWGRAMQDDLTDGVRWLIEQKIADPQRIGIYGISYGGYAALSGLAFTPEFYRCGIADSSVSDIGQWLGALPPQAQAARTMLYTMVGDPQTDRAALAAVSPAQHTAQIKAPLLLAHGGNDPRVPASHSEQVATALKTRGADVDYLYKENEGHSFHLEENRMEFYRRMERFLAKHLGGRTDSALDPTQP